MSRILIIEDDIKLNKNLELLLSSEGFEIHSAMNGKIGVELAKKVKPDLIICDVMMPEMDGYNVLEEISKDPETNTIPFIFLTAKSTIDDLRTGMNAGADDYIFKPFNADELLSAIHLRLTKKQINLEKIEKIKKYLSSKVSHELRTPLVPIIGYSDLIEEEDDPERIKEMSKTIKNSSQILYNKIEKFILYTDLVINPVKYLNLNNNLGKISLDLLNRAISKIDALLRANERVVINLNHNEEFTLRINSKLLEFILTELIENGLKFSNDKKVYFDGYVEDNNYNIRVQDFGVGIEEYLISSISPFSKFSEDNISSQGFGLGLEIVKKIAEIYKYQFSISSIKNNSTTVEFSIPVVEKIQNQKVLETAQKFN